MQIKEVKTADLIPYANNARTHTEDHIEQIAAAIREFGWTNPVLVGGENGIVAGHGRVRAAKLIQDRGESIFYPPDEEGNRVEIPKGYVPVINAAGWTDEQKRAYILADNQLALNAGWDEDLLKVELAALDECGFDLSLIGFDEDELSSLLGLGGEADGDAYTKKIIAPTYEPDGEKPDIDELVDMEKCNELLRAIEASTLPEDEKTFLRRAAARLMVFDYHLIADYYSHSGEEMQDLMERLALVIIDFKKAIENGYVKLTADLSDTFLEATEDDAA
jgi:hypothetical protein